MHGNRGGKDISTVTKDPIDRYSVAFWDLVNLLYFLKYEKDEISNRLEGIKMHVFPHTGRSCRTTRITLQVCAKSLG